MSFFEHIEIPEAENWFKRQATFTDSILNTLNGRGSLVVEWQKLDKLRPAVINRFHYENGRLFYRKTMPGENVGKLYYRKGINGAEVLLFNPSNYIRGKTLTIERAMPSFDGKKIAIAFSEQGAEVSTIKIMNVDTKQFLKDSIYPTLGFAASPLKNWTFDDKGILYISIKSLDNKDPVSRLNSKTKLHIIGTDEVNDIDFFSNASYPDLHISASVYPYTFLNEDSKKYIFSGEFSVQPEWKLYYAPSTEINASKINWRVLCLPADKLVRGMVIKDDNVYATTYNNAKNYKGIATSLKHPDWNNAITVADEKPDKTIEALAYCKDYMFITYSDGINYYLSKI